MQKRVVVTIDEIGNVSVEAFGYKGKSCIEATKKILDSLGQTTGDKKKSEYFQNVASNEQRA